MDREERLLELEEHRLVKHLIHDWSEFFSKVSWPSKKFMESFERLIEVIEKDAELLGHIEQMLLDAGYGPSLDVVVGPVFTPPLTLT